MAKPKKLTMGVDSGSSTAAEERERIAELRATVNKYIPNFAAGVAKATESDGDTPMVLHQDAFAAAYHDDEYTLLGMAIKYAGLHGVAVTVMGKNHDTF